MALRGIRGATTVERNDRDEILARTTELMRHLIERNGVHPEEVASVVFTVTRDLDAEFPALAVRSLPGWDDVPLLCAREIPVARALGRCIRVLVHWNTERAQQEIHHAFLHRARTLRPEWSRSNSPMNQPARGPR